MNAARKLIAFVVDAAAGVARQLEHPECTVGDLQDARRTIAHVRLDLVELDERISAEITRRIARPVGLVPHRDSIVDREFSTEAQHARVQSACVGRPLAGASVPATIHEPVDHVAAVESPDRVNRSFRPAHPLMPAFRPTHRFSPQLRRLIALSPVISAPGRKAV